MATLEEAAIAFVGAFAGMGASGDVTIPAGTTTLTDAPHYNNLVVDGTLIARGWVIFARKVTINATGIIHWDGADAIGSAAGGAFTAGLLSANPAGGAGGTGVGAVGANAPAVSMPRSGVIGTRYRGGSGGSGSGGAGGNAGTATLGANGRQGRHNPLEFNIYVTQQSPPLTGPFAGSGGGAGGGDGTNSGGGGGAGGGHGLIMAGEVINNGIIRAKGGNGGTPATGNCGGGGGGGGGCVHIVCGVYTGAVPIVTGGTGGTPTGTGVAGSNGSDGDYFINQYKP